MYIKYVYLPIFKTFYQEEYKRILAAPRHGRRAPGSSGTIRWTVPSNRLPYIVKSIKNFINKFNK